MSGDSPWSNRPKPPDAFLQVHLAEDRCPYCGGLLDAATDPRPGSKRHPKPGDVSICFYCAKWVQFDPDMRLVRPTPETAKFVRTNPACIYLQKELRKRIKEKKENEPPVGSGDVAAGSDHRRADRAAAEQGPGDPMERTQREKEEQR